MRRLIESLFAMAAILGLVGDPARAGGILYVATDAPNSIVTYDTAAGTPTPTTVATLGSYIPYGMAFGPSGDLFLSSAYSNSILTVSPSGVVSTFASSSLLNDSVGLAFDSAGNLFATSAVIGGPIVEFSPGGVASVFATTNIAQGLAFDQAGNLFVTNQGSNTITKFTPGGVSSIFASGGGLSNPYGLAFDKSGNLFVASANNNTIYRFTPGGVESVFARGGLLYDPADLAFDSAGNLFVGNEAVGSSSIDKFTPDGVGSLFATTTGRPLALAFFQPAAVPEPASLVMLGTGVLGIFAWAHRRNSTMAAKRA